MKHLCSATFLLWASICSLFVQCQPYFGQYNGAVVDAACKMGHIYREVKAIFSALDTAARNVHQNASDLRNKAMQFSSSSAEVAKAQSEAQAAYNQAIETTSRLHHRRSDINDFTKTVNSNFKEYFYRDGDNGFNSMFKTCYEHVSDAVQLSRALEDLEENSQNLHGWRGEQEKKLEEISGEITSKLLSYEKRNDEFGRLEKDFKNFISGTTIHIKTVTFHLANAQSQLIEAQKTVAVAAVTVVNEKVSECKGILAANEASGEQSDEKEKCVQLQAKVEKIQSKIKQEGGSAPRSSADAPLEPTARDSTTANKPEAVLKTGDGGDVVVSEESDSELIDLAVEASGQHSNMQSGSMTTTNLVLAIAIPAVVLCAGVMTFVVMQRNSHAKKVVAAV
ncbi:hypothetical protein, conserved in T. vivax [Trypanosoma vivax Y486]|uniref:Uncharacterized protein n=1 Tax=Trypanosoma vivax (strain Y486) TaxID=1055687 RepID=F9WP77_TRYVY|nr:hypothetical protein, conserved in T. vivax [Trypanosoma vivax Y486]|eukprot:CCD19352.1 hypothetical protein, conserved in T. vivax [Trypanosoma vivax Y486]